MTETPNRSADDTPEGTDAVLLLLNEAISLGRRDGMAGQHLSAMCDARDEIGRLRASRNLIGLPKEPIEGCRPISTTKPGAEMA